MALPEKVFFPPTTGDSGVRPLKEGVAYLPLFWGPERRSAGARGASSSLEGHLGPSFKSVALEKKCNYSKQ